MAAFAKPGLPIGVDWGRQRRQLTGSRRRKPPIPPKPEILRFSVAPPRNRRGSWHEDEASGTQLTRVLHLRDRNGVGTVIDMEHKWELPPIPRQILRRPELVVAEPRIPRPPPLPSSFTSDDRSTSPTSPGSAGWLSPYSETQPSPVVFEPGRIPTPPPLPPSLASNQDAGLRAKRAAKLPTLTELLGAVSLNHISVDEQRERPRPTFDLAELLARVELRPVQRRLGGVRHPHTELAKCANAHFARANLPEFGVPDRMGFSTGADGWSFAQDACLEVLGPEDSSGVVCVGITSFSSGAVSGQVFFDHSNPFGHYFLDRHTPKRTGQILIVHAGNCPLLDKVRYAHAVDALGLIIVSQFAHLEPPSLLIPKNAANLEEINQIPVISISKEDGTRLLKLIPRLLVRITVAETLRKAVGLSRIDICERLVSAHCAAVRARARSCNTAVSAGGSAVLEDEQRCEELWPPEEQVESGEEKMASGGGGRREREHLHAGTTDRDDNLGEGGGDEAALPPELGEGQLCEEELAEALWLAAELGDLDAVEILCRGSPNLELCCGGQMTPLMVSVAAGNTKVAEALIAAGASVNRSNEIGETVLHLAMKAGLEELVMSLLKAGADPSAQDENGNTVLSWACKRGHTDMVEYLLKSNTFDLESPVHIRSADTSLSLLMIATAFNFHQIVTLLLEHGADANHACAGSVMPLHVAVSHSYIEIVKTLLKHGANPSPPPTVQGWTPLLLAVLRRNAKAVSVLLKSQSDPNQPGLNRGFAPLHLAVIENDCALVKLLIEHGADVELTNHDAENALFLAMRVLSPRAAGRLLRLLLNFGAKPDEVSTSEGMNALHLAILRGEREIVELFTKVYCDIDCQALAGVAQAGNTPLHLAIMRGDANITEMLLNLGANVNTLNDEGLAPLVYLNATFAGNFDRATRHRLTKKMVAKGADITVSCYASPSLVAHLVGMDGEDAADLFLSYNQGRVLDSEGNTALHRAAEFGCELLWSVLIKGGGNINAVNKQGKRPLDLITDAQKQFIFKRLAGKRDVMISYSHKDKKFALVLRRFLEQHHITTWMDHTDPTGITSGSVWRDEIGQAIKDASAVIAVLSPSYEASPWCMKELILAKHSRTEILPLKCEEFEPSESLKMHVFAKQIVSFHKAVTRDDQDEIVVDEEVVQRLGLLLLDGVRDTIEKKRVANKRKARWRKAAAMLFRSRSEEAAKADRWAGVGQQLDTVVDKSYAFVAHGGLHSPIIFQLIEDLEKHVAVVVAAEGPHEQVVASNMEGIKKCDVFIPVLSKTSCESETFRDQLAFAEDQGKHLVPVFLGDFSMPTGFAYQLASMPGISLVTGCELSLQGGSLGLIDRVRAHVGGSGASAEPATSASPAAEAAPPPALPLPQLSEDSSESNGDQSELARLREQLERANQLIAALSSANQSLRSECARLARGCDDGE
eukprot:m.294610 g.294610  ORF g.294610 m.294610 type:complete len:1440 (-) comp13030_c0_seq1:65-4384(-)